MSVPRKVLTHLELTITFPASFLLLYTSIVPSITSPASNSHTKAHALSIANCARFGSISFSNLDEASVLKFSFLELTLILVPSKFAHSNTTSVVSSLISEFNPPIIPANPIVLLLSFIQRTLLSKVLSTSSRVVNFSPSLALSTTILLFVSSLLSNACIGSPISSITKLVISTILFIGLTPASRSLSCIQLGDGAILTFFTPLAIYL
ncbi:hypothetical protein CNEONATNEC26_01746 [Clostridium neonatale]|nr:hypothetical protein CNEONATNEC26_01746 [Clostridium neonatale]